MRRLKLWILLCGVLLLGAGVSIGWMLGVREIGVSSGASVATAASESFWRHWVAASDDFWDELSLDDDEKRQLRRTLTPHVDEMKDLRQRLDVLASETHDEVLRNLREGDREYARELLAAYDHAPTIGETLRDLLRLDELVDLRVDQEGSVFRILYDVSRQRHEYFRDLRRRHEESGTGAASGSPEVGEAGTIAHGGAGKADQGRSGGRQQRDPDWRREGRDRMKMIYALRDKRLEQILTAEQFGKHLDWVESCRRRWRSHKSRKGRDVRTRRRPQEEEPAQKGEASEEPTT